MSTKAHEHVFDADGDCLSCGAGLLSTRTTPGSPRGMTAAQRSAWKRDVPSGCPCDYIWTGLVWTRSGSTPLCDLHGSTS